MTIFLYMGQGLIIISKIQPLKHLIITIADDIFCNNFLHFRYNMTKQNQLKPIEKQNTFLLIVVTF